MKKRLGFDEIIAAVCAILGAIPSVFGFLSLQTFSLYQESYIASRYFMIFPFGISVIASGLALYSENWRGTFYFVSSALFLGGCFTVWKIYTAMDPLSDWHSLNLILSYTVLAVLFGLLARLSIDLLRWYRG